MPVEVTPYIQTAARLDLSMGYTFGLVPGSNQFITNLEGWIEPPAVRRPKTARLNTHGNFSEAGTRDERLITVQGIHTAVNRSGAAQQTEALAAFLADGTEGVFTVDDVDLGSRHCRVRLDGKPEIKWNGGRDVRFTIELAAADPRKYGEAAEYETTPPVDGGGLVFPLFSGAMTTTRTNFATNPSFEVSTAGTWSDNATVALSSEWAAAGAKSLRVTPSNTNPDSYAVVEGYSLASGKTYTISATARLAAPQAGVLDGRARTITVYHSGVMHQSPRVSNVAGQSRVSVTFTVTDGGLYQNIRLYNGASQGNGDIWWDAVQIEETGAAGSYFDGDTATTAGSVDYEWTGAAHASASIERSPAAGSAFGVLDYGAAGSSGIVTVPNIGSADSLSLFRVEGYAPGFTITELTTGRRLVYTGTVPKGSTVTLDPFHGTAMLDGSNRGLNLPVREWTAVPPYGTARYLFECAAPAARLIVEGASAWW